jgi:membrane protein YdbS with pleckstrin-like domain
VDERVRLEARQHGVVLIRPLSRAVGLAAAAGVLLGAGWPLSIGAAVLLPAGAAVAVAAVWRWERTRLVLTGDRLFVRHGTLRQRAASVRLARLGTVEVDESFAGRLLGYGTLVAGELEIPYVPRPREVCRLLG